EPPDANRSEKQDRESDEPAGHVTLSLAHHVLTSSLGVSLRYHYDVRCPEVSSFSKYLGCFIFPAMAGYSGTPLPKKLGIKQGARVPLSLGPTGFERALGPLPAAASLVRTGRATFDVIVFFAANRTMLERELGGVVAKLKQDGGLWLAWPKKSSGRLTDLEESFVRKAGLAVGLVDNKICAIDESWSGL